ncbi:YugN family protein [Paenibacillus sp. FSL H7-0331]|uniref:YugN family protein n=1 Tax=Paenibacillus sp. FSL H7-0331 TaxID=1920421 RepID=UPI00096C1C92|nr:YugN family protein [Paenibacillus sp. FSL H7-0331]OME99259.1 hypothetical protein BK127_38870 [Paenibacillus sp. FSL H7-0331]
MIIEDAGVKGIQSDLAYLDEVTTSLGFIRWQWEYTRATYDCKLEEKAVDGAYFLRLNTRAIEGKLESPYAILVLEDAYIGKTVFPHGLDYQSPIPESILKMSRRKLYELYKLLKTEQHVAEMMTTDYVTVTRDATLFDAAHKMKEYHTGFIPVVDGKEWVGVVTERDLAIHGYAEQQSGMITVEAIISKKVRSVQPNFPLEEAIKLMVKEHLRGLPVVENGELLGIITLDDLSARNHFDYELGEALGQHAPYARN